MTLSKNISIAFMLAFMLGWFGHEFYSNRKLEQTVNAEREAWRRYVNHNNAFNFTGVLNSSYGTIVINSIHKDKSMAETEFESKIALARAYKWSVAGEKKIENINGYYKVSQVAYRLFD